MNNNKKQKNFTPAPMPTVGAIIEPMHQRDSISFWEKKERPQGKFVRIIWDANAKKHSAVCKSDFTTGIVAFVIGRAPGFGDVLKTVSVGKNTCRVIAVNKYQKAVEKVIEIYNSKPEVWESIDMVCQDVIGMDDVIGLNIEDSTPEELLAIQAMLSWGVLMQLEHGPPAVYVEKTEIEAEEGNEVQPVSI